MQFQFNVKFSSTLSRKSGLEGVVSSLSVVEEIT